MIKTLVMLLMTATVSLSAADISLNVAVGTASLPTAWTAYQGDAVTTLVPPKHEYHVELLSLSSTGAVSATAAQVAETVSFYVTDWKTETSTDMTVAGQAALKLDASGTEADDGDPTAATAYIFAVNGHQFLLLAHGEGFDATVSHKELTDLIASVSATPVSTAAQK